MKSSLSLSPQERALPLGKRAEVHTVVFIAWNTPGKEISTSGPPSSFSSPDRFWHPVMLHQADRDAIREAHLDLDNSREEGRDLKRPSPVTMKRLQALYRDLPAVGLDARRELYRDLTPASPQQLQVLYRGCGC